MPTVPNFVGPSYDLTGKSASVQRTINMIPVSQEAGNERSPWVFKDAPGLTAWSSSGDAQACQASVILQTSFPGGDSTDISPEELGPGTLLGATLNDGYLRIIGNAGDGAGGTTQYLSWTDPVLIIEAGQPKTFEFFVDATEIATNPAGSVTFMRYYQLGDTVELRMTIEGAIGGINRLNFQRLSSGTSTASWTDTVDAYTAGRRHIAFSIYDDPMAVNNTVDLYVSGVLVYTFGFGQLTATSAFIQFMGGTQVFPNQMQIDISGVRVTNERLYSAPFTPPTEFLPPCSEA